MFKITFGDDDSPLVEEATAPWTRISGCELYEELGRGGMGVVYRARQKALDRIVAVKVLLRAQFAGAEERERFQREAQAAARLKHPGIVGIFDVGEDDGVPWFSMEYISGKSLEQIVREHPMDANAAARCLKQVAEALQHAHEHGVLHRDLKPSNILLDEDGKPRITDFGIARIASSGTTNHQAAELTRTGQILGSPGYAAPEQALHGCAYARTDVYGLGALLYHLLTGRPPFQGSTLDAIIVQLRDNDPLSPRRLNPGVPRDLETICLKCLHKQAEGRYITATAVAEDLGRFLDGRPILARPLGAFGKVWRWTRRHPGIAAMLCVIALLIVSMIGGSLAFARHQARMEHRSSLLSEARASRQLRLAGSRDEALAALQQAWAIAPSDEIRNEAIACLALPEISRQRRVIEVAAPDASTSADGRCVARFDGQDIVVTEIATQKQLARLNGYKPGSMLKLDDHGTRLAIAAPRGGALQIIALADARVLFTCEHPLPLSSVDWSGDLIATGCENRFIYIWDDQGRLKHRLSGHQGTNVHVSFRPHRQELCSTAGDQYLRIWHAARGVEILRYELEHATHASLWWSADGAELHAATSKGSAEVYSIQWSPCLDLLAPPQEEPHTENLGSADFSADGTLAAVIDEEAARLWDFTTGRLITTIPKAQDQWLSTLFSPDGRKLWVCGWAHELTEHAITRDAADEVTLGTASKPMFGAGNLLRDVSADGNQLVLSNNGGGQFIVASPATGDTLRLKHPGTLATAISPDGTWIVTSSYQKPGARIWSLPSGKLLRTICEKVTVMQTLITPDGQRLIVQTSGQNRVFRTRDWSQEQVLSDKLRLTSMTLSPDGKLIATIGDNAVHLFHAVTFTPVFRLILPDQVGWLGDAHPVFDGEGRHLLIHTALGSVARWDLTAIKEALTKLGM
ncbi:MAG: serine/threonine-protein kinase [Prosthecobacter sp.]